MNKTDHIECIRKIGGKWFEIRFEKKSNITLQYYLELFNQEDYHIVKSSDKQRFISYDQFIDFRYVGYLFFKKDIYDIEHIKIWLNFLPTIGGIKFLNRPFPPFNPYEKIKLKK